MSESNTTMQDESTEMGTGDASVSIDGLSKDEVQEIVTNTRLSNGKDEMTLEAAMLDLAVAHKELEEYKKGAIALYQRLDERLHEAEAAENDDLAKVLEEVKKTAYGVYLRLHRGDAELLGEREGKFSGYFDPDQPTPTPNDKQTDGST